MPTVAVIIPGYGDVGESVAPRVPACVEIPPETAPAAVPEIPPLPPTVAEAGWGSVSQFQYSRKNECLSCFA